MYLKEETHYIPKNWKACEIITVTPESCFVLSSHHSPQRIFDYVHDLQDRSVVPLPFLFLDDITLTLSQVIIPISFWVVDFEIQS